MYRGFRNFIRPTDMRIASILGNGFLYPDRAAMVRKGVAISRLFFCTQESSKDSQAQRWMQNQGAINIKSYSHPMSDTTRRKSKQYRYKYCTCFIQYSTILYAPLRSETCSSSSLNIPGLSVRGRNLTNVAHSLAPHFRLTSSGMPALCSSSDPPEAAATAAAASLSAPSWRCGAGGVRG